jgi:hypothetical protein
MEESKLVERNIFNVHETWISTVQKRAKILGPKTDWCSYFF